MYKTTFGIFTIGLGSMLFAACGSDSGGVPSKSDQITLCKKLCAKEAECIPAAAQIDCDKTCSDSINDPDNTTPANCDYSKVESKLNACIKGSCDDLLACAQEASAICPDDGSSGGTGGSSGSTGGSSGSTGGKASTGGGSSGGGSSTGGGSSSGTDCSICDKAHDCCVGLAATDGEDPSTCDGITASDCETYDASGQGSLLQSCNAIITGGAGLNVAACK